MSKNFKRKKLLVNKKFQIKIIITSYIVVALMILGLFLTIYFTGKNSTFTNPTLFNKMQQATSMNDLILKTITFIMIGALVISLIFIGIYFTFSTHKIAGPLYKIKLIIGKINAGEINEKIYLRDHDEQVIKDVAKEINFLLDNYSGNANKLNKVKKLIANNKIDEKVTNEIKLILE